MTKAIDVSKFDHIPTAEAAQDLIDALGDIRVCQQALVCGMTTYGDGESVQYRLESNKRHLRVIMAVLADRINKLLEESQP